MLLTLPFILYGIFRYQLLSDPQRIGNHQENIEPGGRSERPEEVLLKDLPILVTVISWVVTCFIILLLKHQRLIE